MCLHFLDNKCFWLLLWHYSPVWTCNIKVDEVDYVAVSAVGFSSQNTDWSNTHVSAPATLILSTTAWTASIMRYANYNIPKFCKTSDSPICNITDGCRQVVAVSRLETLRGHQLSSAIVYMGLTIKNVVGLTHAGRVTCRVQTWFWYNHAWTFTCCTTVFTGDHRTFELIHQIAIKGNQVVNLSTYASWSARRERRCLIVTKKKTRRGRMLLNREGEEERCWTNFFNYNPL